MFDTSMRFSFRCFWQLDVKLLAIHVGMKPAVNVANFDVSAKDCKVKKKLMGIPIVG